MPIVPSWDSIKVPTQLVTCGKRIKWVPSNVGWNPQFNVPYSTISVAQTISNPFHELQTSYTIN